MDDFKVMARLLAAIRAGEEGAEDLEGFKKLQGCFDRDFRK